VDGQYMGTTKNTEYLTLKINPGDHEVLLKKSGYEDYRENVYVVEGELKSILAYLTPLPTPTPTSTPPPKLYVCSFPVDAEVYVDGKYMGIAGIDCLEIEVNKGLHEVVVKKKGYEEYRQFVDVKTTDFWIYTSLVKKLTPVAKPTAQLIQKQIRIKGLILTFDVIDNVFKSYIPGLQPSGIYINDTVRILLVGKSKLTTGNYEIKGIEISKLNFRGKEWRIVKIAESKKLQPIDISFEELEKNPSKHMYWLIKTTAVLTELSFNLEDRERILVSVGKLDNEGINLKKIIKMAKEISRNPKEVERLVGGGIPTLRVNEETYWKSARAEVTGFIVSKEIFNDWAPFIKAEKALKYISKPSFYVTSSTIMANKIKVSELDDHVGEIVSVEINGIGVNVSVRETLKETVNVNIPADVQLQGEVVWDTVVPKIDGIGTAVGAKNHWGMKSAVEAIDDTRKVWEVKGLVVSARDINESLHGSAIVIFEKRFVRDVSPSELAGEVKKIIEDKKEYLKSILRGEKPEIRLEKLEISIPKVVRVGERATLTVKHNGKVMDAKIYANGLKIARTSGGKASVSFEKPGLYEVEAYEEGHLGKFVLVVLQEGEKMKEFAEPLEPVTMTPDTPVVKFTKVKKNTPINLVFENSKLTKISVKLRKEAENVYLNIRELKEGKKVPDSITYACFEIESINLSVKSAEIGFKVEKLWLHENNLDKNQIRLCRFSENWDFLDTRVVGEDENFIYYSAKTPGFSKFAIVAVKGIESTPTPTTTTSKTINPLPTIPEQPGFEGIFAVIGLIAIAYLLRKR